MKQNPFPKPPPVDPLPLKEWLKLTDRAEVGREPFFRGRDLEYKVFRDAVTSLGEGHIGGGTIVFQGPPGAGKTALLGECMEAVRQHSTSNNPWVAVKIKPESLKSTVEVVMLIIDAVNAESARLSDAISDTSANELKNLLILGQKLYQELSQRGIGIAGFSVGGKPQSEWDTNELSQRIFQNASKLLENFHVVAFIDEAQNTPDEPSTRGVLDCLNEPPSRIPLIAAFFGLGDTEVRLEKCGLSRLPDERVANLRLLSEADTSDAIKSMFDAYEFVGLQQDREIWIERLVELSQGWPQHINRVAVAAVRVIYDNGGKIEGGLLEKALEDGRDRKKDYYAR
ncbi:MAG: ATP-binding protein, partial [Gammaproteobacteria bacterium]|nr:ATP-binding protein [Gammaproteobacteria bacterium]